MWESRLTMPTPPECLQVHYILFLSKNYGRPVVYLIYWCYYNCCKSVFESGCFRWLLFKKWTWPHRYSIWKIFVWIATKTNRMDQWTESLFAFISQQARLRFIKNNNWGTFLWCGKHPSLDLQICWDGTWLIYEIHFYAPLMRICIDRKTCLILWKNWVAKCTMYLVYVNLISTSSSSSIFYKYLTVRRLTLDHHCLKATIFYFQFTKARCEICSKLAIKIPERRQWRC